MVGRACVGGGSRLQPTSTSARTSTAATLALPVIQPFTPPSNPAVMSPKTWAGNGIRSSQSVTPNVTGGNLPHRQTRHGGSNGCRLILRDHQTGNVVHREIDQPRLGPAKKAQILRKIGLEPSEQSIACDTKH